MTSTANTLDPRSLWRLMLCREKKGNSGQPNGQVGLESSNVYEMTTPSTVPTVPTNQVEKPDVKPGMDHSDTCSDAAKGYQTIASPYQTQVSSSSLPNGKKDNDIHSPTILWKPRDVIVSLTVSVVDNPEQESLGFEQLRFHSLVTFNNGTEDSEVSSMFPAELHEDLDFSAWTDNRLTRITLDPPLRLNSTNRFTDKDKGKAKEPRETISTIFVGRDGDAILHVSSEGGITRRLRRKLEGLEGPEGLKSKIEVALKHRLNGFSVSWKISDLGPVSPEASTATIVDTDNNDTIAAVSHKDIHPDSLKESLSCPNSTVPQNEQTFKGTNAKESTYHPIPNLSTFRPPRLFGSTYTQATINFKHHVFLPFSFSTLNKTNELYDMVLIPLDVHSDVGKWSMTGTCRFQWLERELTCDNSKVEETQDMMTQGEEEQE